MMSPVTCPESAGLRSRVAEPTLGGVNRHPADREQNWYRLSEVGRFTGHVRKGIEVTGLLVPVELCSLSRPG